MSRWLAFTTIFLIISCISGNRKDNGPVIHGKVNYPDRGYIYLELLTPEGYEIVDSTTIGEDQTFELNSVTNDPTIYRINFFHNQKNTFTLHDQNIWLEADGNTAMGRFSGVGTREIEVISKAIQIQVKNQINSALLRQEIKTVQSRQDSVELDKLKVKYELQESGFKRALKELVRSEKGSLTALLILSENFIIEPHLDFYNEQMPILKNQWQDSWYFNKLFHRYQEIKKLAIGSAAPDFSLPDPNDKMISLSSFRGKYVYLDFWASWCQPCRIENPELVMVYDKYKSSDFEILGVSLDKKKENWIKAIDHDGLEWVHVSDLKYFDSEMITLYNIENVPTTFLLDPEGKIIAKNIKSYELEAILLEKL